MSIYFEEIFIRGNEPVFWTFIIAITAIIIYTTYAIRKETRK